MSNLIFLKQHFRPPELLEMIEPDHTVFRLRLSSLIIKEAVESLKKRLSSDNDLTDSIPIKDESIPLPEAGYPISC